MMSVEEKSEILKNIAEECLTDDELLKLLTNNPHPICYDGFEPSGRMHIAQGVMKTLNVNKMTNAGCKVKIWIADWFAQLNNKMDGDLNKIRTVGLYFIEIWKASGMNLDNVEFLWSSEEINKRADEYWPLVMDIERNTKLSRAKRCCQIMGRNEKDDLTVAQLAYPCMQCADIFFLKADICQLGMDQRKVNVLALEYCDKIKRENKPVILSHHMLPGLLKGQEKMSKSDSSTAIFMEDEEDEVNAKIKKAYCPPNVVEGNPCLEYIKYLVFQWFNEFEVERTEANGGDKVFTRYKDVLDDYKIGGLHPDDLKTALSKALNRILQPVRDHFKTDERAKTLLNEVKAYIKEAARKKKEQAEETKRQTQETRKQAEETKRQTQETKKQAEEDKRQTQETKKQAEETKRQTQETKKQAKEIKRQTQETKKQAETELEDLRKKVDELQERERIREAEMKKLQEQERIREVEMKKLQEQIIILMQGKMPPSS